jgi:hypothetical protein
MQQENEQNNNNFVSKIIIIIEGKEVHLSSESTSLKDFGIHISQLNLIDKEGNHMISQIQQPITALIVPNLKNLKLVSNFLKKKTSSFDVKMPNFDVKMPNYANK